MQKQGGFKTLLVILLLSVTNFVGIFILIAYFASKKYNPSFRKTVWKWMSAGQDDLSESPRNVNQNSSGEFSEYEFGDTSKRVDRYSQSQRVSRSQEIKKKVQARAPINYQNRATVKPIRKHVTQNIEKQVVVEPPRRLVALTKDTDLSGLNERQIQILKYIQSKKYANMKDINNNFKEVSQRTLRRDMERLEKLQFVKQSGKTRDSMYEYIKS